MPSPALLANTNPRIVSILGANPGIWSANVSGSVGAFPNDSEIAAATLEADGELITRAYFNSINNTLAQPFMSPSSPIAPGGDIPTHYGNIGKVEIGASVAVISSLSANIFTPLLWTNSFTPVNGQQVSFLASGGTVPTGVTEGTTYYLYVVSASTFSICTSLANAYSGTVMTVSGGTGYRVIAWQAGVETEHKDDIANAVAVVDAYVQVGSLNYFWKIDDGAIWHSSSFARVEVPTYTRTTILQANMVDEPIIIALAVGLLTKNASPAMFAEWSARGEKGIQSIIRDGSYQPQEPDMNL